MEKLKIIDSAIGKAKKLGAEMVESYFSYNKEMDIEVRSGKVDTMKLAEDRGIGLRIFLEGRTGFAFTTDLTVSGIDDCVKQALDNASQSMQEFDISLPKPVYEYPQMDLYDQVISKTSVDEKINLAIEMEEAARSHDQRVKIIESSSYSDGITSVLIANSLGMSASFKSAFCGIFLSLVAAEAEDSQTGFAVDYNLKYKKLNPTAIGQEAASRAVRMLGAKSISTRQTTVVFDPIVAVGFLGLMAPSFTAEAVHKGRSLFANKVGSKVASDLITIIDDGSLIDGIASTPFDGEGVPTSRTDLVHNGELKGYLHNTYTASKDGVESTGNGIRGSFKSTPEVGTTNFYIETGSISPDNLIKDIKSGLYITEVMGMHTANPISGDFSVGVSGLLIEDGQITKPVRGVAMAGNIISLLSRVNGVGNDLKFFGGRGAPTLRIEGITISGS